MITVVEEARRQGSLTVAITNIANSKLAQAAELVLPLGAGEEVSVPASKTYTASLVALATCAGLLIAGPATPYRELFIPFIVIPLGMGVAVPAMTTGILSSVEKTRSGFCSRTTRPTGSRSRSICASTRDRSSSAARSRRAPPPG